MDISKCKFCEYEIGTEEGEEPVCEFCKDVKLEGMLREEVKELSIRNRTRQEFEGDIEEIAKAIFEAFGKQIDFKGRIKDLGKKDAAIQMFLMGIVSSLSFFFENGERDFLRRQKERLDKRKETIKMMEGIDKEETIRMLKEDGIEIDMEKLEKFNGDITTFSGLIRMVNETMFAGDWEKHLESEKKRGDKEAVEFIEKIIAEKKGLQ